MSAQKFSLAKQQEAFTKHILPIVCNACRKWFVCCCCEADRQDLIAEASFRAWRMALNEWKRGENPVKWVALIAARCASESLGAVISLKRILGNSAGGHGAQGATHAPSKDGKGGMTDRRKMLKAEVFKNRLPSLVMTVIADRRQSSPADNAAIAIDFAEWMTTTLPRERVMVKAYLNGSSQEDVSRMLRLGRNTVSYHRGRMRQSWNRFQRQSGSVI